MSGWQDGLRHLATSGTKGPRVAMDAPSTPNLREHWSKRAKRTKGQRGAMAKAIKAWLVDGPRLVVVLTRVGKRELDSDNLAAALKGVRDGVADSLRIDDGSGLVEWQYRQRTGEPGVEVSFQWWGTGIPLELEGKEP